MARKSTKVPRIVEVFEPTATELFQLALSRADDLLTPGGNARTPDVRIDVDDAAHDDAALIQRLLDARDAFECDYAVKYTKRRRRKALSVLRQAGRRALTTLLGWPSITNELRDYGKAVLERGSRKAIAYAYLSLLDASRWELDYMTYHPAEDTLIEVTQRQQERGQRVYHETVDAPTGKAVFAVDTRTVDESDLDDYVKTSSGEWVKATNGPSFDSGGRTSGDPRGLHVASSFGRKVKRWAYCGHCKAWFETKAKKGTARHTKVKSCRKVECAPPERKTTPTLVIPRRSTRNGVTRIYKHTFTKSLRGGWVQAHVDIYVGNALCESRWVGEVCPAALSHALQARYTLQQQQQSR